MENKFLEALHGDCIDLTIALHEERLRQRRENATDEEKRILAEMGPLIESLYDFVNEELEDLCEADNEEA